MSMLVSPVLWAGMTLNDCLVYARDHAHDNRINYLETRKASADRQLAAADFMPTIGLNSSGNISFGRNIDPETNTYDNKKTLYTGFGLSMSLPVFDGLVNVNTYKAARVAELRQVEKAQIEQDIISLNVIKAFYNVSYCKTMVAQMEEQLERDNSDLRATRRGLELGVKSGADVAQLEALVATDEYELTNQRNLLDKAYLTLRSAMGMELNSLPLDLIETDDSATASLNPEHPRITEARLALEQSRYELRRARGYFSPRLSLNAGISTSYYKMIGDDIPAPSFKTQWHDNMGQYVGFSLSIPLFNGLSNINLVKRARLEVRQNETRLEQTIYTIEKETAEAALDLRASIDEHSAALKRLESEEIAFNATRRKYELGSASAIDLYTSSAKLAAARANLEAKRIAKIINTITLGYYRGEKLIKE